MADGSGEGHEGGAEARKMRLDLIAEGKQQFVYVPAKVLLSSVMKTMGATNDTVVSVVKCNELGYKAVVELDVSGISWMMINPVQVSVIEGEVCANQQDAESSCVQKALKYITVQHRINIKDYSTRRVESIDDKDADAHLYDALGVVRNIVEKWKMSVNFSDDLSRKLENREEWGRKSGSRTPSGEMYIELCTAMDKIVRRFTVTIYEARKRLQQYESEVAKETERANEICNEHRSKGYFHSATVSQKDLLQFVLDYIGAGQATYVNSKGEGGCVNSELVFFMPYLKNVKFVGNLKIHGKCLKSTRAEEHAAYKALRFIEKNYKVRVVDLNYNERLEATKVHNNMVTILEKVVPMVEDLKTGWINMLECLQELDDTYYLEPRRLYDDEEKIEAYAFCKESAAALKKEYEENYNACQKEFNDMKALGTKINDKSMFID